MFDLRTQKYIFELILVPRLRFPTDGTRAGVDGREDEGPNLYAIANAAAIAACRITTVCHPDERNMEEQGRAVGIGWMGAGTESANKTSLVSVASSPSSRGSSHNVSQLFLKNIIHGYRCSLIADPTCNCSTPLPSPPISG